MTDGFKQLCIQLEHFVTPQWAVDRILEKEIVSQIVVDPCCGSGVLSEAARRYSSHVLSYDIENWGYAETHVFDWLSSKTKIFDGATCLMNPPFSLATQFVEKSFERGCRKVICFQRFAWYESKGRREFWENYEPNRIYICGDRADCWRHDIPVNERGKRCDPQTGRELAGSPTAHAWFIFDRDAPNGTILGRIYK